MDSSKLIGLILLMILTAPLGGIILIPVLYFFWKYIKLCIKLDFYTIYLAIRIPIWLVIQVPAHLLKVTTGKVTGFFEGILGRFRANKKVMGAVFALLFGLWVFVVPSAGGGLGDIGAGIGLFTGYVLPGLVFSILVSATIAGIWNALSEADIARSIHDAPPEAVGAKKKVEEAPGELAGRASEDLEKAAGVYKDIQKVQEGELDSVLSERLAAVLPGDMAAIFESIGETLPFVEGLLAGSTGLGPAIILVLLVLFLLVLFMALQWFLVLGWFFSTVKVFLPMLGGPVMGALGLGEAYGNYFGTTVSNQYFAGISFEAETRMLDQAGARIGCALKGPSCLRQWQLNNTQRPGSEDVGEQYGLKIEEFRVGQGQNLDVAYKNTNYAIPISFTISNPRHGLKGINAKDVNYRLKVIDSEKEYCDTGWIPVEAYDLPGDGDKKSNDIYPGTSASTGFLTIDSDYVEGLDGSGHEPFTLESCNMLQPALGSYKTVMLEVRYDYFSQSTLYFDAMSLQNYQADPELQKSIKESKTADTPVKASVNVNSPVLYDSEELGTGDASQPFAARASLDTEEYDLRYLVNGLKVRKSRETVVSEKKDCQFEDDSSGDENMMKLSEESEESIVSSEDGRKKWFDSAKKPPIFGCVMELGEPASISPSGETLTMGVEANYTVALEERLESFKVYNSKCGAPFNCPLLLTRQQAEKFPDNPDSGYGSEDWMTKCTGIDAGNGCSVVEGPEPGSNDWARDSLLTGKGHDMLDGRLEQEEIALDPVALAKDGGYTAGPALRGGGMDGDVEDTGEVAIGLREKELDEIVRDSEKSFVMYKDEEYGSENPEVKISEIDDICRKKDEKPDQTQQRKIDEGVKKWMENRGEFTDVIGFRVLVSDDQYCEMKEVEDLNLS